jgi:hypothetical protein
MSEGIKKTAWAVLVLLLIGVAGAFAQQTPAGSKEVPLGSPGSTSLDLQISGKTSGSGSAGQEGQMMADMMKMAQSMMGSGMGMAEMGGKSGASSMGAMPGMGGASSIAAMPGMGGSTAATDSLNGQLAQQLLVTNSLVTQLLASMASSNAPAGTLQTQLSLVNQLLANQAAMMQTLAGSPGASTQSNTMQSNTMSGMAGM